jgi:septum formation protein
MNQHPATGEKLLPVDRPVILASSSPRRRKILAGLGLDFRIETSEVIEESSGTPDELAMRNAWIKAHPVAAKNPDSLVIGSDTVVALHDRIYGKPADMTHALKMLTELNGSTHTVHTGVAIFCLETGLELTFADCTEVTMKNLHQNELKDYLSLINPLDKAGAYAIQEHGERIVAGIKGSFANVVGFPTELFVQKWNRYVASS